MLSLGAGLYEELLFRVLLVSAIAAGARVLLGVQGRLAGVLATVVGAIVFSAFHTSVRMANHSSSSRSLFA
jgi:membrane protease YdiL (CAAX protease family)